MSCWQHCLHLKAQADVRRLRKANKIIKKQFKGSALCDNWELKEKANSKNFLSKFHFQKLIKISINQVRFFDFIIIFEARKCLRWLQIYVSAPLYPSAIMSCALLSGYAVV